MIKSIFFDVDGTLLSFKTHAMSEKTKEALEKARKKGIKLFIATGRSPKTFEIVKKTLGFEFDGYVMLNGQYCVVEDKVIHSVTLPKESLESIIPYLEKEKISCEFVELDYMYTNFVNERVIELRKFLGSTFKPTPIEDPKRSLENETYQLCAYINEDEEKDYFENMPKCRAVRWNKLFVDVIPSDGGKGVGIKKMIDYLGISQEETMAFGDGGNDIEMLEFVKIGVAMGNAGDNVKKSADYVTESVDDEGIYKALKKFEII